MDQLLERILAIISGGVAAFAGYRVLDMVVGLTGPPAADGGPLTGIEQSLSVVTLSAIGGVLLLVALLLFLTDWSQ